MDLSIVKKYNKMLNDRVYPGMFTFTIGFYKGRALLNDCPQDGKKAVEKAFSILLPMATQCSCFHNGSWLEDVRHSEDFEEVMDQTEDDYMFDIPIMNLITLIKIFYNKSLTTNEVYLATYDNDSGYPWYAVGEDIQAVIEEWESEEEM